MHKLAVNDLECGVTCSGRGVCQAAPLLQLLQGLLRARQEGRRLHVTVIFQNNFKFYFYLKNKHQC